VLGDGATSLVGPSRHATLVDLGGGDGVQGRWLEWLETGPAGAVVLPVSDDGLELVAHNRARLEEMGYILIEANDEVLLAMLDKGRTYELAERAGIAFPPSLVVRSASDAAAVAERIGFPCALKPLHSHRFTRHFDDKLLTVEDGGELAELVQLTSELGLEMLATALIPGGDERHVSYYTYIDSDGEPLFGLTKLKLRQYPIHFGIGTYHLTDWAPEVAEEGLRFCQGIGLRGIAHVEFKRDPRDEGLKLIECNHRFTGVNEILRRAGIDLGVLTYDRLLGRPVTRMPKYRSGVRLWSPIEDLKAIRDYNRDAEMSYGRWLSSLLHRKYHYYFDWRDPMPTLSSFERKFGRRVLGRS
jgi:predicted ATP-grasp superfamily ATP-dependent carboligase